MPSIAVRDFGPIAQAEVDLKPLTVLIGPNNTGKSYLAAAIYSLFRAISRVRDQNFRPTRSLLSLKQLYDRDSSVQRLKKADGDWDRIRPEVVKIIAGKSNLRKLPETIKESLRVESRQWATVYTDYLAYELQRCLGSNMSQLARKECHADPVLDMEVSDHSTGLSWKMCRNGGDFSLDRWEPDTSVSSDEEDRTWLSSSSYLDDADPLADSLMTWYAAFLLRGYSAQSHYLPASRSGIIQEHKAFAGLIVGRASTAWIESSDVKRLPGVVTDLVQALLVLDRATPPAGKIKNVVEFLETNVVAGSLDVKTESEYPDIQYQNQAGEFSLHQVSSMVSEVASIVLYLKYLVRTGHLLIVEEPESHLHPTNQSYVARAVAMLVNAGVRILVTTHSDIFLNQINNLIQVYKLQPKRLAMPYEANEMLNPNQVAAYVFQQYDRGTRVTALPIDSEYGISTESFNEVHRALYDEAVQMEHSR